MNSGSAVTMFGFGVEMGRDEVETGSRWGRDEVGNEEGQGRDGVCIVSRVSSCSRNEGVETSP
jgi:hypothetical protein